MLFRSEISKEGADALKWLFQGAQLIPHSNVTGWFIGPRKEMITPWSTTAAEITKNMNIEGIERIEEFFPAQGEDTPHDKMLQRLYNGLDQEIFDIHHDPEPVMEIEDIAAYNQAEGLALSDEEVAYLENLSKRLDRKLTDGEVFGFSQVNSEH